MAQFEILYIRDGQTKVRCLSVMALGASQARAIVRMQEQGWLIHIIACEAL